MVGTKRSQDMKDKIVKGKIPVIFFKEGRRSSLILQL